MDLPTYTKIWRIEKRLYKLYDFRLPVSLPLIHIGVFVGVLVPWVLLLQVTGVPFRSPFHVLYILPPLFTPWLATRPVVENKRLTELLLSQARYFVEPRVWCRLVPAREPAQVVVFARVWRRTAPLELPAGAASQPQRERAGRRVPGAAGDAGGDGAAKARGRLDVPGGPAPAEPARARGSAAPAPSGAASGSTSRHQAGSTGTHRRQHAPGPPGHAGAGASRSAKPDAPVPRWPDAPAGGLPPRTGDGRAGRPPPRREPPAARTGGSASRPEQSASRPEQRTPGPARRPTGGGPAWPDVPLGTWPAPSAPPGDRPGAAPPAPGGPSRPESPTVPPRPVTPAAPEGRPDSRARGDVAPPSSGDRGSSAPEAKPAREAAPGPPTPPEPPKPVREKAPSPAKPPPPAPPEPAREAAPSPARPPGPPEPAREKAPKSPPGPPPDRAPDRVPGAAAGRVPERARERVPDRPAPNPPPGSPPGAAAPPDVSPAGATRSGEERRGLRRLAYALSGRRTRSEEHVVHQALDKISSSFTGARRVVVLGCTGGAGQTVTAIMLGHTLARHRSDRIVAVDLNPGIGSLSRRARTETPETLTSLLARAESVGGYLAMRAYTSQSPSRLEVLACDDEPTLLQSLSDQDYATALSILDRHYKVVALDPAPAVMARLLPFADQLVLVAPASEDASQALTMTFDWLDDHHYRELRQGAVTVVNGVSRRSLADAQRTGRVAERGCRAVVRVPWDDHLGFETSRPTEPEPLRLAARDSYLEVGAAVAAGFPPVPPRYHHQDAPDE